ncbi:MAG: hypothetical protein ABSE59_06900 [Opitutaceae bacterium]
MSSSFHRLADRLARKLATGLMIALLGLAGCALWLFWRDPADFTTVQRDYLAKLSDERQRTAVDLDHVNQNMAQLQSVLAQLQAREQLADKTIAGLRKLQSWWGRWFGDRDRQRAYADRLVRAEQIKHDTEVSEVKSQRDLVRAQWQKDGLEIDRDRLDQRIRLAESHPSRALHYLTLAWDLAKWYLAAALGLYLFGSTLGKLLIFFGLARLVEQGRPVRLSDDPVAWPQVSEIGRSLDLLLWPGERLWVKEAFLQEVDDGLWRHTRILLDWRLPVTCLACGLFDLVALRNTRAGRELHVTFARNDETPMELALVSVPDGSSLVLRPSFLQAVILSRDTRLRIRRHWRFFHWRSWIGAQFRFFEFAGPCRLLVAASPGLRVERLAEREGPTRPIRRAKRDMAIAFTPSLDFGLVRAERFMAYFRNVDPLFDDGFSGAGLFLCRRLPAEGTRKFWSKGWGRLLKIFGI